MQTLHVEACGVLLGAHSPFTGRDVRLENLEWGLCGHSLQPRPEPGVDCGIRGPFGRHIAPSRNDLCLILLHCVAFRSAHSEGDRRGRLGWRGGLGRFSHACQGVPNSVLPVARSSSVGSRHDFTARKSYPSWQFNATPQSLASCAESVLAGAGPLPSYRYF